MKHQLLNAGKSIVDLNKLNCMNYHVSESNTNDFWYAQNGIRSLYAYSKLDDAFSFRAICEQMSCYGEITLKDNRTGNFLTLTMI